MLVIYLIILFSFHPLSDALAQPNMIPPHNQENVKTGGIMGTIFIKGKGGKQQNMGDQTISITIYRNGEQLLVLNKKTTQEGHFHFSNIFMDPGFSYTLETNYQGRLYRIADIKLKNNQPKINFDFQIGEGSPFEITSLPKDETPKLTQDSVAPMMAPAGSVSQPRGMSPPQTNPHLTTGSPLESHHKISLMLVAFSLILAGYFYFKPTLKK